jgi:hypothetical protein
MSKDLTNHPAFSQGGKTPNLREIFGDLPTYSKENMNPYPTIESQRAAVRPAFVNGQEALVKETSRTFHLLPAGAKVIQLHNGVYGYRVGMRISRVEAISWDPITQEHKVFVKPHLH